MVGVVVWSDKGSPLVFHTYTFPSDPILLILVSSQHNTLFQSSTVQFSWSLANLSLHCRCVALSIGTFFFVAEWRPASFSILLTVWDETGSEIMELMNWVAWTALSSFSVVIWCTILCLSCVENLDGWPPGWFSLFSSTSLLILPTVPSPRPVPACIWWWEYPSLRRETTGSCWAAEIGCYIFTILYFYSTLFPLRLLNSLGSRTYGYTRSLILTHFLIYDSFSYLWLISIMTHTLAI